MKKILLIFPMLISVILFTVSCSGGPDESSISNNDNFTSSDSVEQTYEDYKSYLLGDWMTDNGEREPIDENTINGTPYILKNIKRSPSGDLTYTLTVNGSDVIYTVYRYKVGYAEYSYMEAVFAAKDIVFRFYK